MFYLAFSWWRSVVDFLMIFFRGGGRGLTWLMIIVIINMVLANVENLSAEQNLSALAHTIYVIHAHYSCTLYASIYTHIIYIHICTYIIYIHIYIHTYHPYSQKAPPILILILYEHLLNRVSSISR